jgi:hypothetical protein
MKCPAGGEGGGWAGHGTRDAYLSESTDNEMNSAQTPGYRREICQVEQKSIVAQEVKKFGVFL